jgi:hypothetical protein
MHDEAWDEFVRSAITSQHKRLQEEIQELETELAELSFRLQQEEAKRIKQFDDRQDPDMWVTPKKSKRRKRKSK